MPLVSRPLDRLNSGNKFLCRALPSGKCGISSPATASSRVISSGIQPGNARCPLGGRNRATDESVLRYLAGNPRRKVVRFEISSNRISIHTNIINRTPVLLTTRLNSLLVLCVDVASCSEFGRKASSPDVDNSLSTIVMLTSPLQPRISSFRSSNLAS